MPQDNEQNISRRGFLKAAAVTAVAATATGAGAALLNNNTQPVSNQLQPVMPLTQITQNVAAPNNSAATELFAQLAAVQAENVRLQAKLDAAERRLQTDHSGNEQAELLRMELDSTTQQVSLLSGLVALYEQLEAVDLGEILDQGLASVTTGITSLLDDVPTLSEGIEAGRQALDELEDHIPALENGRRWIDDQISRLQTYHSLIEALLISIVDATGPFLQMLNEWVQKILKWLPFGIGQQTSDLMQAISNLLMETPQTVDGLGNNVGRPMDKWLKEDNGEVPLRQNLVKPLRERVLSKAEQTIVQVQQVNNVYQTQLAEPAQTAANNQGAIRNLIADYRQRHQI